MYGDSFCVSELSFWDVRCITFYFSVQQVGGGTSKKNRSTSGTWHYSDPMILSNTYGSKDNNVTIAGHGYRKVQVCSCLPLYQIFTLAANANALKLSCELLRLFVAGTFISKILYLLLNAINVR